MNLKIIIPLIAITAISIPAATAGIETWIEYDCSKLRNWMNTVCSDLNWMENRITVSEGLNRASNIYINQEIIPYIETQHTFQYYAYCDPGDTALSGSWHADTTLQIGDNVRLSGDRITSNGNYYLELLTDEPIPVHANIVVEVTCVDLAPG